MIYIPFIFLYVKFFKYGLRNKYTRVLFLYDFISKPMLVFYLGYVLLESLFESVCESSIVLPRNNVKIFHPVDNYYLAVIYLLNYFKI